MSEAEDLREACDDLLGSLDASIAIVERLAAENLGVAALMRVHRGARARARRLLAGLPDLPARDDDTEDLLRGVVRLDFPAVAATDAAIDAPMPVTNVPAKVPLLDDEAGDEDDTAQGALRAQLRALREAIGDAADDEHDELFDDNEGEETAPARAAVPATAAVDALVAFEDDANAYVPVEVEPLDDEEAEGPGPARALATPADLSDEFVNFDEPLVQIDEESVAGAAPSYVTYDEPAPPRAAPRREAPTVEAAPTARVEVAEDAEPLSVASMALGSSALVEFDEPLVRVDGPKARRDEDEGLFSGSGVAPTPNLARLPAKPPAAPKARAASEETFDLMPDVEETEVGLKPLPVSATTTDLEAVDDDNSAGEVLLPSQVASRAPARPMIVRPAARGGSSAAARVAAKTGAAPAEPTAPASDARLVPAESTDSEATPGTAMGRAVAPPTKSAEPTISPPVGAKSAARAQRPAPGSVPTIRESGEARPRGAAVQLGVGDQAGTPKVLGLEEEFEPLEMGEAEGDVPVGEGFQIQVEEYDDVYEEIEEEKPDVMPVPAPPPPPRVGPGKAEIRALLDEAHEAVKGGQNERAVDLFSDVLDADPDNVEGHIGRGRLYLDLADYARAMSDFTVAEDIDENSPEPQVAIGDLYFARKDYRKAIDYFSAALQMSPNHAMAYCRRGISHYYRKNYVEALDDLLRAQRIDNEIPNISTFVAMAKKKAPPPPRR